VVVQNLTPGEHQIVVRNRGTVYQRVVPLAAGTTSTVVIGGASPVLAAGWLTVASPLTLQVYEDGRLIGTTNSDRLLIPTGDHQLTFTDEQTGFRAERPVRITAGDTSRVVLEIPRAPVNLNATPWAEVWIANQRIGETPIGNYMLPLGRHEVELRHPELGAKRATLFVTVKGTNRLAVNMRER
jgi:hypothetical protein